MNRHQQGFTLTELLIVIAVLGTLIAATIVGWQSYRQRAYDTAALACAKEIRTLQAEAWTDKNAFADLTLDQLKTRPACDGVVVVSGQNEVFAPYPDGRLDGIWGKGASASYGYVVTHPGGTKGFAVSEGELGEWGSDPTFDTSIRASMDEAIAVASGGGGSGGGGGGGGSGPAPTAESCTTAGGALLTWNGTVLRAQTSTPVNNVEYELYPDGSYRKTDGNGTVYFADLYAVDGGGNFSGSAILGDPDLSVLQSQMATQRADWEALGLTVQPYDNETAIFLNMQNFYYSLPPSYPDCGYPQMT